MWDMPTPAFYVGSGAGFGNEPPGLSHMWGFVSQDGLQTQRTQMGFLLGEIKL